MVKNISLLILLAMLSPLSMASTATSMTAQQQFATLEASSIGHLGISALDTNHNQRIEYHAHERFPMGCTSKVIAVAAVLKKSMDDNQLLQKRIMYKESDLVNWVPITKKHLKDGMTVNALCAAAISYSDNTAMNLLLNEVGGLQGVNEFAHTINGGYFHMDHSWPEEAASSKISEQDATTPAAMEERLQKIALGTVLAPTQREQLLTWLKQNVTGNARIRAGVPKGWIVGDKTGTGSYYGTTNDIAVIWPPHCSPLVVTIYYSSDRKDAPEREDIIANATRILIHEFSQTDSCIKQEIS